MVRFGATSCTVAFIFISIHASFPWDAAAQQQNRPQNTIRTATDDEAIYFGVFARDEEPGRVIVNDLKKDFNTNNSDGFRIVLDTFHDARNGYSFAINPAGAKWDAQMANEGRERNANWDGIWDVATRLAETGWYAEIRIPFRTLKFEDRDVQAWGINFERKLRRLNEDSYWSPVPRIYDLDRVSMAGTVEGLRGVMTYLMAF